ncbi:Nif3-like dinuclear metal center hexameric protein [Pengzhenrongella sicca]|uniref:GTP cyclohydrolase 1 type 2 homolog n=1 Tax=Pengzhenrongella sicca TaxID=2819238 RepID=A0A8A4ZJU2_9MICO|nr:Nif3-like dinuclear metal center hexameric protein [Pengzhenrongella sicca]
MASAAAPTLADVVAALERRYPPGTAMDWDAVGLVAGDPGQPVRRVLFAVDPTADVVDEAVRWGADLLVTHHPLLLRAVHSVAATTFKGALVHRLIREGVALHVAHTNADAAVGGVAEALAAAVGLVDLVPLVPGEPTTPTAAGSEPVGTGIGRVGRLPVPMTLREFGELVSAALPRTAQGVRLAGDLDATIERVAVVGGSGDSLFDDVRAAGVDAYLTADLRHHPASELRERAQFEVARGAGAGAEPGPAYPFLVDVAHFASEWPWLERAAADLVGDLADCGTTVDTRVSTLRTDPWTARLA